LCWLKGKRDNAELGGERRDSKGSPTIDEVLKRDGGGGDRVARALKEGGE